MHICPHFYILKEHALLVLYVPTTYSLFSTTSRYLMYSMLISFFLFFSQEHIWKLLHWKKKKEKLVYPESLLDSLQRNSVLCKDIIDNRYGPDSWAGANMYLGVLFPFTKKVNSNSNRCYKQLKLSHMTLHWSGWGAFKRLSCEGTNL